MTPKLDTAGTLERIFEMYSRQFSVLLSAALIIYLPVALLQIAARGNVLLVLVVLLLGAIASTLFQGAVVQAVSDMQDGRRDASVGEIIQSAVPFIAPLLAAGILFVLGVFVGFLLLVVPGLILLTVWSLIAPIIVVERPGVIAAFGRSRALVKDNGWRVFGVLVVIGLIAFLTQQILVAIGAAIGDAVGAGVGYLVAVAITAPLSALTAAILYFTLVGMKEGGAPAAPAPAADPPFPPVPPSGPSPFGQ